MKVREKSRKGHKQRPRGKRGFREFQKQQAGQCGSSKTRKGKMIENKMKGSKKQIVGLKNNFTLSMESYNFTIA